MRVKALGVMPMVDATGNVMDRSEAVTLFNDMCLLAPATLVDAPVLVWRRRPAGELHIRRSLAGLV
jgi:hypothetical protein